MDTNCAPLVADLFLFCFESDFMTSLSDVKQSEIIEASNSTSRYLDDLLNISNTLKAWSIECIHLFRMTSNVAEFNADLNKS